MSVMPRRPASGASWDATSSASSCRSVSSVGKLEALALVHAGEVDDVLDEGQQPRGLGADAGIKPRLVPRLHKAGLKQLRRPHDGVQRGLELVGDVRGELAPELLCPAALRDVEGQQHGPAARDGAGGELVLQAHAFYDGLRTVSGAHTFQQRAQLRAAVHGQDVLAHAVLPRAEELSRGRVYAQDPALRVQEDEALRHAARHGLELAPASAQLLQLAGYLPLLPLHAREQGRELVVGLVLQRVVQVYGVERPHDAL